MATTNPMQQGKRYRRLIIVLAAIAIAILAGGMVVDQVLPALLVYAALATIAIGTELYVRFVSDVPLMDERERELHRHASHITIWLFGYVGFFVLVGLMILDAMNVRELGPVGETLLDAFAVVYLSWGAIYLLLRYRQ